MKIWDELKGFTWQRTFALSVLAFVFSFPSLSLYFNDDPDGALVWLFNSMFIDLPTALGPFVFPHGLLAFLLHPLDLGWNLFLFISFVYLSKLSAIWSVSILLDGEKRSFSTVIKIASFCALLIFLPSQQLVYLAIVAAALSYLHSPKTSSLVVLSLWVGLGALIKTDLAVYALISFVLILSFAINKRNWRHVIIGIAASGGTVLLLWTLIFGLSACLFLPDYIVGNYHLLFANEGAMTLVDDNWLWLGVGLLFIACTLLLTLKKWLTELTWVLLLLPLMASWKHGMVRHDSFHAWAFFFHVLTFWVFIVLSTKRHTVQISLAALVSLSSFFFAFSASVPDFDQRAWLRNGPHSVETAFRLYEPLDLSSYRIEGIDTAATIDALPYNLFYASMSGAKPYFKPIVQSYAANSSYLDGLNAQFFEQNGPDVLIWHANRNGDFESIDGRSSFSDAPQSTTSIWSNYFVDRITSNALVLTKSTRQWMEKTTIDSSRHQQGQWLAVESGDWITMNSSFNYASMGARVEAALLRSKPIYVNLKTESGDQHMIRLPRTLYNKEVQIGPLFTIHNTNELLHSRVDSIRLIYDTNFYTSSFDLGMHRHSNHPLIQTKQISTHPIERSSIKPNSDIESGDFSESLMLLSDSSWFENPKDHEDYKVFAHTLFSHSGVPNSQLILELFSASSHRTEVAYANTLMTSVDGQNFARLQVNLTQAELQTITSIKCYVWNASENDAIRLKELTLGLEKMD